MKKQLLFILSLLFVTMGGWAQTVPGQPVVTIGSPSVCYGATTVDVPITIANLATVSPTSSIGSFSLEFNFTDAKLTSPTVVDLNSGLSSWTITSTTYPSLGSGVFKITGIGAPENGFTLADGAVLFKLHFVIQAGFTPSTQSVTFYENTQGSSCEFTDATYDYTPYTDYTTIKYDGIGTYYKNGSVTKYADFTVGTISTTGETICYNGDPAEIGSVTAASGGDASITYQWQSSLNGTFSDAVVLGSSNSATYNPSTLTATTTYRRQAHDETCHLSFGTSTGTWKVTVYDNFSAGTISNTGETICYAGNPATITSSVSATGGDATITYQWQSSLNAGFTGTPTDINSNTATYTPASGLAVTTWYRRQAHDGTCNTGWNTSAEVWKVTVNVLQKISGTYYYYNSTGDITLKTGINVELKRTSDNLSIGTTTTTSSGTYEFTNLCPDNYFVVATSTITTDGSVNGTDAAQVNYWGTSQYEIEKVRFLAGDVSGNNFINAPGDALPILLNFVNGTSFTKTDKWVFWLKGEKISDNLGIPSYPSVTLSVGSDLSADMYGLCTGDFNRSFNPYPAKAGSSSLALIYNAEQLLGSNQLIDLPVHIVNSSIVGAVSLVFNFPADMVEVQDVVIDGDNSNLKWAVKGNELRIGWYAATPLTLDAAANLLTLKLKTKASFTNGNEILFALAANPANELANGGYAVINNAVLSIDKLKSTLQVNNQNLANGLKLSNHPNPFNASTTINYSLPFDGKVSLEIYNYMGKLVKSVVSENQVQGNYSLKIDADLLTSGIYMATLRLRNENNEIVRTIKIINNK